MKRKAFLQTSSILLAGGLIPVQAGANGKKKKPIRFAHLSDIHVKPGKEPESGMARAYQHVQDKKQKVDFIINGGDMIMDALEAPKDKTQAQWDLYRRIIAAENKLPVYNCIGNHDIWGWFFKANKPVDDRLYGKQWAIEMLEMPNRFYTFSKSNWEFIVLDSTQLNPAGGYIGKLDEEQLAWLEATLRAVPPEKYICIISHIPILSISSGLFFNKTEPNGDMKIQRNLMHSDFLVLKKLFLRFPNIRCCISGHTHLQDEIEYLGIKYYCNGAVCGNWWKGPFQEFAPAYAEMELFEDGSSRRTIVKY
jgi:3',5'-cyclic AMP phosphodiesterase CpdA